LLVLIFIVNSIQEMISLIFRAIDSSQVLDKIGMYLVVSSDALIFAVEGTHYSNLFDLAVVRADHVFESL